MNKFYSSMNRLLFSIIFFLPHIANAIDVPYVFVPNNGQLVYTNGKKADDVLFYNNFNEMKVLFKKDRITYLIEKFDETKWQYFQALIDTNKLAAQEFERNDSTYYYRIDLVFENANPQVELTSESKENFIFRYYLAQCPNGIEVTPSNQIIYKNLYPGVDVKFYGKYGGLKYDIIIHPEAKTDQIAFRYEGAENITLQDGRVVINTPAKNWTENIPFSFTQSSTKKQSVDVAYALKGNTIQFRLPEYNKNEMLVIDPAMTWSTYFNFQQNTIWDMDAHAHGDKSIYMTRTGDQTIPDVTAGTGAYLQTTKAGTSQDLVLLMFNTSGVLQWATFYGGSDAEYLKGGVRFDSNGLIYVVAMSASSNFPLQTRTGAFNQSTKFNTFEDLVVMRFNNNGVRDWATFIQTDFYASNAGMDIGPNNHLFIGGYFGLSYKFPASVPMVNPGGGAYFQSTKSVTPGSTFDDESFILEFNTSGTMVWATYFGSTGPERLYKVKVTANGSIFMLGTASARQVTSGGTVFLPRFQNAGGWFDNSITTSNPEKLYLVKFNANRSLAWASLYGGTTGSNNPPGGKLNLCSDSQNNIYVVNGTRSNTFPTHNPGGGAYFDGTYKGDPSWDSNFFILKFANNTSRLWATFFSGTGWYTRPHCAVCSEDNLYVTSGTNATDHPTLNMSGSYFQASTAGGKDGMVAKFSSTGALQWSTYVGGVYTDEELNCITVGGGACGKEIIVYGRTGQGVNASSSSWPLVNPGGGAYVQGYPGTGYYQVAISRFSESGGGGGGGGTPGIWGWTGAVNTDWFEPCNWDKLSVPTATSPVVIPNTSNKPVIANGNAHCLNIELQSSSGATLTIRTDLNGDLQVHQ